MRRQQSPRFHSGTSLRILLIASCFLFGPSLIPAISNWSMAGRRRGLMATGFRTCSTAPNIQNPHSNSAGNYGHIDGDLLLCDEFSAEWSVFRASTQNREFTIACGKVGESFRARKPVQVAGAQ